MLRLSGPDFASLGKMLQSRDLATWIILVRIDNYRAHRFRIFCHGGTLGCCPCALAASVSAMAGWARSGMCGSAVAGRLCRDLDGLSVDRLSGRRSSPPRRGGLDADPQPLMSHSLASPV